jgi:hypothetical protein
MSDFKRMRISGVELMWPRLDKLYRYDPTVKRDDGKRGGNVEATADEDRAQWSVTMKLPEKRGKLLYEKCKEHFKARKPDDEFGDVWGYKEVNGDELSMLFTVALKAKTAKGKYNEAPAVTDELGEDLPNKVIWSGSTADVYFTIYPAYNPSEKKEGISLRLERVVVTNPIYGGDDYDDLDETPSAAPAKGKVSDDYDDEIPF